MGYSFRLAARVLLYAPSHRQDNTYHGLFRYALTRLRVASHRLSVEMERWNKPNPILLEDRTCYTCKDLDDKYHFVLVCSLYDSLRKKYIPIYLRKYPCMFKCIVMCNSNNAQILRHLALYCYKALELRNSISYI